MTSSCRALRVSLLAAVFTAGVFSAPHLRLSSAEAKATKEQKVRQFLQLTGADALGKQMMDGMMANFSQMPGLPPGFTTRFRELAMKEDLSEMLIPVYLKNLEEEDLDGLIKFYQSPSGKKFIAAQPAILQESMAIGQKWGTNLAERAMKDSTAAPKSTPPAPTPK